MTPHRSCHKLTMLGAGCVDATIHATRCHGSSNGWGAFHAKASGVFGESCSLVLKKCSSYRDLCGFSCEGSPDTISISPQLTLEEMLVRITSCNILPTAVMCIQPGPTAALWEFRACLCVSSRSREVSFLPYQIEINLNSVEGIIVQ